MSDRSKDPVHKEPYTSESGYSKFIKHEQMDPAKELGDAEHHPEHHSSGYSEHGQVVDPTHNVNESANTPHHTEGSGQTQKSGQTQGDAEVPQEPQQHDTTYSEHISDEPLDPVQDLGTATHHPQRAETMYSEHAPVTEPTKNADE